MDKSIMPECYADTLLIETLIPSREGYNHKSSCSKVEREMRLGKLKDRFAVGIIDKDKKQIKYLNEFIEIDKVNGSLILWRHRSKDKHHYFVQICPALERWVLNICEEMGIDLLIYKVGNNLEGLKKYTKDEDSINDEGLMALFKAIGLRDENVSVRKLKIWISKLKEKNYQVDIKELQHG
jgi:hypothetical protein